MISDDCQMNGHRLSIDLVHVLMEDRDFQVQSWALSLQTFELVREGILVKISMSFHVIVR